MNRSRFRVIGNLEVYQLAFEAAMRIFDLSKGFPAEERYSLTDQVCRSSRSVCANLAEAWRKRRYDGAFLHKLSDSEAEAAETQTWLEFAVKCNYLGSNTDRELYMTLRSHPGQAGHYDPQPIAWLIKRGGRWSRGAAAGRKVPLRPPAPPLPRPPAPKYGAFFC
jgi:four helix bundle protein